MGPDFFLGFRVCLLIMSSPLANLNLVKKHKNFFDLWYTPADYHEIFPFYVRRRHCSISDSGMNAPMSSKLKKAMKAQGKLHLPLSLHGLFVSACFFNCVTTLGLHGRADVCINVFQEKVKI